MNHDYDKAWREIDSLEQQGLPKPALAKTESLLAIAKAENAQPQIIKCLIYKEKYQSQLEEDGFIKAIEDLKKETKEAPYPTRNILQSMLAELYSSYLDNNYWDFKDRTQTLDFDNDDLRTWTIEQLTAEASRLYLASIDGDRLKSVPTGEFGILLSQGENSAGLRPTLFDFLANRAIDYFSNERTYLTQPAYKFEIDNPIAFAPVEDFTGWKIETKDTNSLKRRTLELMQELLRFRNLEKTERPAALLTANLQRLHFVFNNAVMSEKDSLYVSALERLQKVFDGYPAVAEVYRQLAQYYQSAGSSYQPAPLGVPEPADSKKWFLKKAKLLCDSAIEKFPKSYGARRCAALKARIERTTLHMETEEVNLPEQPFLAKLEYRNLTRVWLKIIRFDEKRRDHFEGLQRSGDNDENTQYINGLPAIKTWSVTLPDDGDFHQHSVEISVAGLPLGQYLFMVSENEDFSRSKGAVGYLFTHVSNIGLWERQGGPEGTTFVTFDRQSGTPIEGLKAEIWVRKYN
ncbi:MAG: hypothetical protein ACE5FF_16765, partial [Saprospiraceae bacterium]